MFFMVDTACIHAIKYSHLIVFDRRVSPVRWGDCAVLRIINSPSSHLIPTWGRGWWWWRWWWYCYWQGSGGPNKGCKCNKESAIGVGIPRTTPTKHHTTSSIDLLPCYPVLCCVLCLAIKTHCSKLIFYCCGVLCCVKYQISSAVY